MAVNDAVKIAVFGIGGSARTGGQASHAIIGAENDIQFCAGGIGTERMRITAAGGVLIGTAISDAAASLRIESTAYHIKVANAVRVWGFAIHATSGSLLIDDVSAALNRFSITTAGRVLIGPTSDSSDVLQATGNVTVAGRLHASNADTLDVLRVSWNGGATLFNWNVACQTQPGWLQWKIRLNDNVGGARTVLIFNGVDGSLIHTLPLTGTSADDALIPNNSLRCHLISNTQLAFRVRGSDGTMRQAILTLA